MRMNKLALSKIKSSTDAKAQVPKESVYAYLETEDKSLRYDFLLNPTSIDTHVSSVYESQPSAGTNVPRLQFRYGEAQTLTLNGIIMVVPGHMGSLKPLMDASLAMCRADTKTFRAPVLNFVWGARRFDSCVLESFSFKETMWSPTGEPTFAEGSMSLKEVPKEQKPSTKTKPAAETTNTGTTKTGTDIASPRKLSERELSQGTNQALSWVKNNLPKLSTQIQQLVRRNQAQVTTDPLTNIMSLVGRGNEVLTTLGVNKDGFFKPK